MRETKGDLTAKEIVRGMWCEEDTLACFGSGGWGHTARSVGTCWNLGKAKKQIFPENFKKEHSSADTMVIWTSGLRNCVMVTSFCCRPQTVVICSQW